MSQRASHTIRLSAAMSMILVGAIALQVSCRPRHSYGTCEGGSTSHPVTAAVVNSALSVDPETVQACPGDTVSWSKKDGADTNTYTVQFDSASADACGWNGVAQTVPASCTIPSGAAPTSGSGDKYTATCSSGAGCAGVAPLDPHIIILGR
jgi:plastocyanin